MAATVTFLNRTYEEALSLTIEARNYIAFRHRDEADPYPPQQRVTLSYETMRLTTRLTQVMAWLLAQKAVQAGEISLQRAASEEFALGGHSVCLEDGVAVETAMPRGLAGLMDRSLSLYQRIDRLDQRVREAA